MSDFVEIRKLIGALLRMWWLIVLLTVIFAALGYLYSKSQTPIYEATATLIVGQSIQSRDLNRSQIQTSQELGLTYSDLARRFPVLNGTAEELGLEMGWQVLRGQIDVGLVRDTQLIEISARSTSPQQAEAIANEVARQLIILSPTGALREEDSETRAFVQNRLQNLQEKILVGEERLQELQSIDLSTTPSEDILQSQAQIAEIEKLITDWESNYSSLLGSLTPANDAPNYLEVIEPALARNAPVSPRTLLNTLVALIVGMLLGASLALLLDYLDGTIHAIEDVPELANIPYLGEVGRIPGSSSQKRLLFHQDLYSRPAEDYRLIRSKLQLINQKQEGSKSILFTSPGRQEGCSLTVANMGIAMAQAGLRTVIVDADLRQPNQHTLFEVTNDRGLVNLLCYPELNVQGLLKTCKYSNLKLLNAGALWDERSAGSGIQTLTPTELLTFETMQKILAQLMEHADVVLLDAPPIVSFADTGLLSKTTDGVILVLTLERSENTMVKHALTNLAQAQAMVFGYVSNSTARMPSKHNAVTKLLALRKTPTREKTTEPMLIPAQRSGPIINPDDA